MLRDTHPYLAAFAGPLLGYLDDPAVMEIRVNSDTRCFVLTQRGGKTRVDDVEPDTLDAFLAGVASLTQGGGWLPSQPRLHAAHAGLGFRIQAGRPPISPGPWMVCRKHPQHILTLDELDAQGVLQQVHLHEVGRRLEALPTIRQTLEALMLGRWSVLVSGAVGSAKTTIINALLAFLSSSPVRIVILEDDEELHCEAEDVQVVHTSDSLGITMEDLTKDVLRMSPGLVVIGEVRGGETLPMLQAFQTGTPGLCTIHAPSAQETLPRVEQLVQRVSVDPQRHLIGNAVDAIVHMTQYAGSWRVTEMLAVEGWDGTQYQIRSVMP